MCLCESVCECVCVLYAPDHVCLQISQQQTLLWVVRELSKDIWQHIKFSSHKCYDIR